MKTYRQKHPYIAQIGYILRYKLQRFTWMFKVKDCRHICLFCEYYDTCRQEGQRQMNMKYAMRSEDTEQINVVSWANWNMNRYPELRWLFHVPNGGSRNKQEAVKFKQMGVKAGVSDLYLPYPKGSYCGLFVEMKFGNNRQQDTQKEFLADMAAAGHFVATCYSAEEAIKVIEEYLNLALCYCPEEDFNNKMSIPNNSILKDGKVKGGRS
jgi:hypothetical protein